ncbi:MAG: molecular chaperone DnaJ [Armatimonadota bacterium]|nr:molecular chaperone DnaJ [Armatimonadota bacterium]
MATRDLYEILGVDRRATQEEIKQAYRRLARETHPDVRPNDPTATERFKEINEAYSVLSDPAKRSQYDRFGQIGADRGPFGGSSPFDDIFDMFFGARPRTAPAEPAGPERGADLRYDLEITLEDVAWGVERRITVPRLETCPACFGTGAERGSRPETCPACRGTGEARVVQRTVFGTMTQIGPCGQCGGTGTYIANPCRQCRGAGRSEVQREVVVKVPAGVEDGMSLRLTGEGEAGAHGGGRGDLYVVIRVAPHPVFTRRGRDLIGELPISMVQAALGDEVQFAGLEGTETVRVPPGTQPGDTLTVHGRGLPDLRGGRGNLYLNARVQVPKRLTAEQRALLEALAEQLREPGSRAAKEGAGEVRRGSGARSPRRGRRPILDKMRGLLQ